MRRVFFLLFTLLFSVRPAASEERFLVRIDAETTNPETPRELLERLGLTLERRVRGDGDVYLVSTPDVLPEEVVRELLAAERRIRRVEAVRKLRLTESIEGAVRDAAIHRARRFAESFFGRGVADVGYYGARVRADYVRQPLVRRLRLRLAHRYFGAGAGVVAVIDTGVDPSHPALAGSLVPGYDFVHGEPGYASEWTSLDPSVAAALQQSTTPILDQSTTPILMQSTTPILDQSTTPILSSDEYTAFGHGTLVAGLIRLVSPRAKIMPLKTFRADGTASTADIVDAISYAVEHGADVINMSFSFQDFSPEVMRAVNYATRNGVVCVSAAGNLGEPLLIYPASFSNVTGVAALTPGRERSSISNFGEDLVSLAAPGEEVLSTYPGERYASVFGTSFSTAIVSGAVALLERVSVDLDQHGAETALGAGRPRKGELGHGALDLLAALEWARKTRSEEKNDDDRYDR